MLKCKAYSSNLGIKDN